MIMSRPWHLLLIDDDDDLRETMTEALRAVGFTMSTAANGRDALLQLSTGMTPDVILLDLLMPVMDGWQFCEARRRESRLAQIPVIAMSAAVSRDPASPYYLEVEDFLAKPVDLDDLLERVARFTGRLAATQGVGQ